MTTTTIYLIAFIALAAIVVAVLFVGVKQIKSLLGKGSGNRNIGPTTTIKPTITTKRLQHNH